MIKSVSKLVSFCVLSLFLWPNVFGINLPDTSYIIGVWEPYAGERADGRVYVEGTVYLDNLDSDNGEYVTAKISDGGFEKLDMTDVNGNAAQLNLESNLHIFKELLGTGTFSNSTGSDVWIYFHESQLVGADKSFTFTGEGDFRFVLNGNGFEMEEGSLIQLVDNVDINFYLQDGWFSPCSDWFNASGSGSKNIWFDTIGFYGDPGLGLDLDTTIGFSFDGVENKFNAGFTLPKDCELGTMHPFSGVLDLNGHTLTVSTDLVFEYDGSLVSNGGAASIAAYDSERTIYFNSDQTPGNVITFYNDLTIDGGGKTIILNQGGDFTLADGVTLTLKNVKISSDQGANGWYALGVGSKINIGTGVVIDTTVV